MITTLTLGPVTFATYEIPQQINFGGDQALAVHQLVGGQRVVDAMGRVDDDITWSGLFFGSTATFRARFLDGMRVQGLQLPLTWSQFSFNVIIKSFKANFQRGYQIPYTITVTVVQDLTKPIPVLLPVGYNDAVQILLAQALDLAVLAANANVTSAMAALALAINAIPDLGLATDAELATVVAPLLVAQSATINAISITNTALGFLP